MKINKWALSLNTAYGFFINKKMYESFPGRAIDKTDYYINGFVNRENANNDVYINIKVKHIDDTKIISESGSVYELGEKAEAYLLFEDAVNSDLPIIYNWYIGINGDEYYLSGAMFQDGCLIDFTEKIINQEGSYLILEKTGKSLLLWGAVNPIQRSFLKPSS
jgi:hypothetical protein